MASLLEKFKFTSKAKSTMTNGKSSCESSASTSQDSEVTCIPETPSSESSKRLEASPVFHVAQSQKQTKADSSENSPTFLTDANSRSENNVRRDILSNGSHGLTKKLQDLPEDDVKDSDETYFSESIHSNRTVESAKVRDDQECHTVDDDIEGGMSPVFQNENGTGTPESGSPTRPHSPSKDSESGENSSDSEIESSAVRRRKKRALSPWNGRQDDEENGTGEEDSEDEDDDSDDEIDVAVKEKPSKRRRVDIRKSSSIDETFEEAGNSQMKQLKEMFPHHSQKDLEKAISQCEGSLDIAVSLLIDASSTQENSSYRGNQLTGKGTNENGVGEKKKKPLKGRHRITSSEDEEDKNSGDNRGSGSDSDLPEPFAPASPSKSPDTTKTKQVFPSSLSKFAYNSGWVSKEKQQKPIERKGDSKMKPIERKGDSKMKPIERKGDGKPKPKKVVQKKKKRPTGRRRKDQSSEDEEDEEDCSFVVREGSDSDGGHMGTIDQSGEEEEEEAEAISSDDDDDEEYYGGGNEFSESFQTEVVQFFNTASKEELGALNGCSGTKANRIIHLRPFDNFGEVVEKLEATNSLSVHLIENCEDLFGERQLLLDVLNECCTTSQKIQNTLVEEELANDKKISLLDQSLSLKPYQLVGVNWMKLLHRHKINGILADEMGLGKTIQVIAFLASLMEEGNTGPHLVVAPASTLENWLREFNKWCPSMEAILYSGDRDYRMQLAEDILYGSLDCNVLITSYSMATSDVDYKRLFKRLKLQYSVYDEGHMLKNVKSLRYKSLMKIKSRQKLLLTGTPLQNNLLELMSLICFVVPTLDSPEKTLTLQRLFSNISSADESSFVQDRIQQAKQIMEPFVLRRVKDEVLAELPKKIIQVDVCPMVPTQQIFYQELKASLHRNKDLKGSSLAKNTMSALMELRKLANHPLLMRRLYTNEKLKEMSKLMLREPTHYEANPILIEEDMGVMSDYELHHLCTLYPSVSHFRLEESAIRESGKFKALDRILPELKEQGLKVLLFSQFVMMLDIMEPYMKQCKHNYLRMDGSSSVGERGEIMDKFINDPDIFVFLLSTKACGLGINLTVANTVILYDIDYNPHNDKQAEDRCHRVGQTKEVTVIKLVSKGTVDESMLQRAQQKLHLEKQMTSDDYDGEVEKLNIADLLKEALEVS